MPRLGDKVVELAGVGYRYPVGNEVLSGVDLALDPMERLGVVGANGSGKSTLLDLLAGRRPPSAGRLETGPTVVVGYYDQRGVELDEGARVRDLVAGPTRVPGSPEDNQLMERFWFTSELQFARVATLSGGERRRLQLLLVLASRPNVLLLDEPTNDLDLDTLRALEDFLDEWPGALVTVSHDRAFLERATERLVALDGSGSAAAVPGGVAGWLARVQAVPARQATAPTEVSGSRLGRGRPATAGSPGHQSATGRRTGGPPAVDGPGRSRQTGRPGRSAGTVAYRLRELDKEVARLQRRRDRLSLELAAVVDHLELARLGTELAEAQRELDQAEDRWLALAEEAEATR
jgi:ATP-binding cassette subfamily F protein uup